jgi:hypothetical protein
MATSPHFNNYNAKYDEQRLVEDLITESIQIMGFNAYYLPNNNDAARDLIYGEDPIKKFKTAFAIEMYLSSSEGYMGDQEMFTKFGLEIRDQVTVIVSKRAFSQRVPQNTYTRPREGDLVYVPFLNGEGELYEIKFTEQSKDFFMLGRKVPYYYELKLEKFKYSQEVISTGVADIDQVVTDSAYTLHLNVGAGTGSFVLTEIAYQSPDSTYANATSYGTVQSWIPSANTLSVTNIYGEFIDGNTIIGKSSNAHFILATYDTLYNPANKESYDNELIQTTAQPYINTSETNPIGGL